MSPTMALDWKAAKAQVAENQAAIEQNFDVASDQRREQVYRERARQLAARKTTVAQCVPAWAALAFRVGDERFCLPTAAVVEVLRYAGCTPIPGARSELLGVVNIRGNVCAVLDLVQLMELPECGDRPAGNVVLVRNGGIEVGLRVDEVDQIAMLAESEMKSTGGDFGGLSARFVQGRTADGVGLLNLDAILSHPVFHPGRPTAIRQAADSRTSEFQAAESPRRGREIPDTAAQIDE